MQRQSSGASLRITGQGLDFDEISESLGLVASQSHRAGEAQKFGELFSQDIWLLESPLGKHKHLETHLKWLVRQLKPGFAYLRTLKSRYKIDVFCHYTGYGDGGMSLSPTALSIFIEIGIKLELSIIVLRPNTH